MPPTVTALAAEKPRDRSIAARRAARSTKFERERLIVDSLNRGVAVAEIAERIGVTEKRMRALVKEILARRTPAAPEQFAALQASRLNEALLVAYGAMSPGNLKAVALVVRIVRELDRYHGFAAAGRRPRRDPRPAEVEAEAPVALAGGGRNAALPEPSSERKRAFTLAPAQDVEALAAPPRIGAEKAPQALEKMEIATESGAFSQAPEAAPKALPNAQSTRRDGVGAASSNEASPPAAAPQPDPACAAPCAGPETAPQVIETIGSAVGNSRTPAAAAPSGASSPHADAFAGCGDAPGPERDVEHPLAAYPVASVMVPDHAAPGGFRRVNIRMLPNGMAVC